MAHNTECVMFYWIMVQLLMVDVPDTDVQRIRCRSSNAFGDRVVVLLWAIFVVVYLKLNWKLVSKKKQIGELKISIRFRDFYFVRNEFSILFYGCNNN